MAKFMAEVDVMLEQRECLADYHCLFQFIKMDFGAAACGVGNFPISHSDEINQLLNALPMIKTVSRYF